MGANPFQGFALLLFMVYVMGINWLQLVHMASIP